MGRLLCRLLCRLGLHRWAAFAWPPSLSRFRRCCRCGAEQIAPEQGGTWRQVPSTVARARRP